MTIYDNVSKTSTMAAAKHKKRVVCGDWNCERKFAFASDDRQITVTAADGKTVGQVFLLSPVAKSLENSFFFFWDQFSPVGK